MKGITETEYYCRVRKILKSKLNGGNVIAAINLRAVLVVIRYRNHDWTKNELEEMDRIKKTPRTEAPDNLSITPRKKLQ